MKRTGIVLSLMSGEVIGKIETSEKAGIHEFSHYTSTNCFTSKKEMVNSFNARLSFSKSVLARAERQLDFYNFDTLYHYNFNTNELES